MSKASFTILRVGVGITFLWVGILIFKEPEVWGGYLLSWAVALLPLPPEKAMLGIAVFDVLVGIFLIYDVGVWIAGLFAALHMLVVLTVVGITDITVRDIAIFSAALAIMVEGMPRHLFKKIEAKGQWPDQTNIHN